MYHKNQPASYVLQFLKSTINKATKRVPSCHIIDMHCISMAQRANLSRRNATLTFFIVTAVDSAGCRLHCEEYWKHILQNKWHASRNNPLLNIYAAGVVLVKDALVKPLLFRWRQGSAMSMTAVQAHTHNILKLKPCTPETTPSLPSPSCWHDRLLFLRG